MTIPEIIHYAIFAFLALVTIGSAVLVAFTRRIIHAAFWLFPVFAGIAGFYLYLGAQFLAAIQVLIYIGAILVLIVFAVTLTRHANDTEEKQSNRFVIPVLLASFVMLLPLIGAALLNAWPAPVTDLDQVTLIANVPVTDVSAIGVVLMQQYLVPFEIASVLLLAAMVGALVLARKERPAAEPADAPTAATVVEAEPCAMAEVAEV